MLHQCTVYCSVDTVSSHAVSSCTLPLCTIPFRAVLPYVMPDLIRMFESVFCNNASRNLQRLARHDRCSFACCTIACCLRFARFTQRTHPSIPSSLRKYDVTDAPTVVRHVYMYSHMYIRLLLVITC